ncbi:L-ring protein [Planctomyces bekefii]|uniref:L-ring protein n=1 Tax=Planctomyces bekefii TaxID=1653850 RepID=A0A5C6MB00_9PLAN|nr:L-ring protein [Planctomyces bekefii]
MAGYGRGSEVGAVPEMYVRQRRPVIREGDKQNSSGSLFNPDDERNFLYTASGPQNVGRFLTVNVVAGRGKQTEKTATGDKAQGPEGGTEATKAETDQTEQELLKALPDLAPKTAGENSLVKNFKMQIMHRYSNGDVLARVSRRSQREDQAHDLVAEARIPYDRLASGDALTTDDLLDVNFLESGEGELIERRSSGWEDEYSLRLSGFNEAKSKYAAELADQKKQIEEAKEKLETKIKAFGDERKQVAKQRDDLAKKNVEADSKVKDLEDKVNEQQSTIEDQKKQLEQLQPENKPADSKEASRG